MISTPSSPPVIPPLGYHQERPLWSVMIPVYNCASFLEEALRSVLVQAPSEQEMQIEVVDDASTDTDVEALVKRVGNGRIQYYRQPHNVGSLRNFETCINRSRGKYVHLLHGDDKVRIGYYKKIAALFHRYPEAGAAFCRYRCVDEHGKKVYDKSPEMDQEGILQNWLVNIGKFQRVQYAAIVVRREVYEQLGGFFGIMYGEDWEMWVRIAKSYPVAYTPEILAEYRKHLDSISGSKFISGEYLQDLRHAMMLIQDHLPERQKKKILRSSKKHYANYALRVAKMLWQRVHNPEVVNTQVKHALKLYQSPRLYFSILKLYLSIILGKA